MFAIGRLIGTALAAAALAMPLAAQETRIGEDGFESPPASLDQMDWLVGQWTGDGIGGAPAMESWLPETGGTMVGTFIQQTDEGAISFTEHLYLMEEQGSLVLRLKHFTSELIGWEEKEDMLTFRLVAIEPCAAYFNALTLRCADPAKPGEGLIAAVRMKSDKPDPQELLFRFTPLNSQRELSYGCDGTTFAINQCLAEIRDKAAARESRYFEAAVTWRTGLPARMTARERDMRATQAVAEQYRKLACADVYEHWKDGTIRNAMMLRCEIRLIDKRTQDIWQNWLTFQDSSEPILPEPEPSR